MKYYFSSIGIVGHPRYDSALNTHKLLHSWLVNKGYNVIIENKVAHKLRLKNINFDSLANIGKKCDLAIVVGGDGNMLCAARILSCYNIKIIGINRGNLGFLTDLNPDTAFQQLYNVLSGEYFIEKRFLLEVKIVKENGTALINTAINEVVLHAGHVAHMIDFEVYINNEFAFSQRSDGLIISTPTGSTGYSLSAGGPILVSSLEAMVLIPMFPHTLSSRPLVINSTSIVYLKFKKHIHSELKISCDSQVILPLNSKDNIFVKKSKKFLCLLHPKNYNYFNVLSSKLNWSKRF
ncbi:putative inorganic polyphosphate/ATP-NAD kinase [Buchnera aphidicola str. Bp (Baizongia pistaciae)]|uniref:NAD kinase n=1 Tax=Buchnera aphidicola subsp. Baizongia pistaciae (strain Bp) TaxID=224915 RepID=NADK_BUCBP|nr:NAD(+) kinase [Buchnera aphidicola]Q89AR9.1 RecName: Full=NAD kinase; AltName: Full=ATP-dependent NAD kinase [Buchnera aphidicola str. Bp (Baizongia pistaciae)]AAO26907.1 putative inorganic polyphosphate/ATP-NAD kinase [Buchnera aphidicola str. Bp (Baizongia pistaciae)]